jgi:hypothetical protein
MTNEPLVYERHDSITVDFGGGRKLRAGRYSDKATDGVPDAVFAEWCNLRDQSGTYGERVRAFVRGIRRVWPAWDSGGTPRARKAARKSSADEYGRDAVQSLQLSIRDAAESVPLPPRFMEKSAAAPNAVVILDISTGRSVKVGLCDLRGVRETLSALFG